MNSKAAVLVAQRAPLEIIDVEIPLLKFGQVLVRVLASGICGSQLGEIDGIKGPDAHLPHLLGHEGCGEVLEVGEGVRTVKEGDRVVLHWRKGEGFESVPAGYKSAIGHINAGWVTTFQEYTVVSENRLTKIPYDFDPAHAALLGCAVTTGFGVICNQARLRISESIAVFGVGGVGLAAIMAARIAGAFPIIAIDIVPERLQLASQIGATTVLDSGITDPSSDIIAHTDGGADVVIENTGVRNVIENACTSAAANGRIVLVGVPQANAQAGIDTLPLHFGRRLIGSTGGESIPHRDIPRIVRMATAQRLCLGDLIGARVPFCEINEAIAEMRDGSSVGRTIVMFE